MTDVAQPDDRHRLRASDEDRHRAAEFLREAAGEGRLSLEELDERLGQVYSAKTYAELEPITDDLPVPGGAPARPAARQAADPDARVGGTPGSSVSIAIMSGVQRKAGWVVPPEHTVVAFCGGAEFDLREARFAEREATIRAFAVMGGVEITVPDDITVIVDGVGIMGGFDDRGSGTGPAGSPTLRVTGFAFMGGVEVKRKPRRPKPSGRPELNR